LVLTLDHINGVNDDHRLHNLRLLCPNCHSQTPTFGGKNTTKARRPKAHCVECGCELFFKVERCRKCTNFKARHVKRPTMPILLEQLALSSYRAVGKHYGVCDNTIRKWVAAAS